MPRTADLAAFGLTAAAVVVGVIVAGLVLSQFSGSVGLLADARRGFDT